MLRALFRLSTPIASATGAIALLTACPELAPPDNHAPVAVCTDRIAVAAPGTCTGCAYVAEASYDPDGDPFQIVQTAICGLPSGDSEVGATVTDIWGAESSCTATVTVIGGGAPLQVTTQDVEVWPPDHALVDFVLSDCVTVTGGCGEIVDVDRDGVITAAWSDEPEDALGGGDGHTVQDVVVDGSGWSVRAERQGSDNGRVYGASFTVTSSSGQRLDGTCHVTVPHSDDSGPAIDDGADAGYSAL